MVTVNIGEYPSIPQVPGPHRTPGTRNLQGKGLGTQHFNTHPVLPTSGPWQTRFYKHFFPTTQGSLLWTEAGHGGGF